VEEFLYSSSDLAEVNRLLTTVSNF